MPWAGVCMHASKCHATHLPAPVGAAGTHVANGLHAPVRKAAPCAHSLLASPPSQGRAELAAARGMKLPRGLRQERTGWPTAAWMKVMNTQSGLELQLAARAW